jgi:hypothetical protein
MFQNVANNADSQQQMAVFSCQLKKLESEKKTYEVATEKLLQFAEVGYFQCCITAFVWKKKGGFHSNMECNGIEATKFK